MSERERQSFEDAMKGMSDEERKIALAYFDTDMLWDELRRRETESRNIIRGVRGLVE